MALFGKPKFTNGKSQATKREISGEWLKCKGCNEIVNYNDLRSNFHVCSLCGHHYLITAHERIRLLVDKNSFVESDIKMSSINPLNFKGYQESLDKKQEQTKLKDAIVCGFGKIKEKSLAIAVMDFKFMGASMGSVVGEKITRLVEKAVAKKYPVLLITASGGARMQEGCLSLMQMAKTSGALAQLDQRGLPLFCLLTNPTYGGVTASFASLGDIILAEPKALIGFAGVRVIETTIREKLPEGFQTAEFLVEHGLVDRIVERSQLRQELDRLLTYFKK